MIKYITVLDAHINGMSILQYQQHLEALGYRVTWILEER